MAAEESAKSLNKAMKGLGKNFILFFFKWPLFSVLNKSNELTIKITNNNNKNNNKEPMRKE